MVKYYNFDIVFAEIPGEVTLAINITNCPNRCPGCHSPHLIADTGQPLDNAELLALLDRYGHSVTCVCFMGGDAVPHEIAQLAAFVRLARPSLRIGWYSGRDKLPEGVPPERFDYLKLGPYIERLGPLTESTSNQRLYRIQPGGHLEDITERLRRKPLVSS